MIQASLEAVWLHTKRLLSVQDCVNVDIYLWVRSRITERNFQDSALNSGVKQHSEHARKSLSQQWILKKAERRICCHEWPCFKFILAFLAGSTSLHEWYIIDIYIWRTTKLLTPIIKSFFTLKVLIQTERFRWFMVRSLHTAFV